MASRPVTPRIPPRRDDDFDDQARALLAQAGPGANVNIFRTLLWHPDLLESFQPFGAKLRRGILPARDRELVVLRVAWRCQAETEWGGHTHAGHEGGLSDVDLERITAGPDAPGWQPFDAALLRAVDELHDDGALSDETWAALSDHYDRPQLIELILVIGNYHMLSYVMNAFGVEPEPDWRGFPPT